MAKRHPGSLLTTSSGAATRDQASRDAAAGAAVMGAALATGVGAIVVRLRRAAARHEDATRWRVVTVLRDGADVGAGGSWPAPLADIDGLEIATSPAPGDRGTELRARYAVKPKGEPTEAVRRLRTALREAKSLLEVGEVLLPDVPTTRPTSTNAALRWATANGRGEGRL